VQQETLTEFCREERPQLVGALSAYGGAHVRGEAATDRPRGG
jgi:hypothetical protein